MKANELRDMTAVELEKKLKDLKAELFNLHGGKQCQERVRGRGR